MKILLIMLTLSCVQKIIAQGDYKSWLKKENEKYRTFLSEDDKKFYEFLKKEWKQFDLKKGDVPDKQPKPVEIPKVNDPSVKPFKTPDKQLINKPSLEPKPVLKKEPEHPPLIKSKEVQPEPVNQNPIVENNVNPTVLKSKTYVNCFDEEIEISSAPELVIQIHGEINSNIIAEYWKSISNRNIKKFLESLNAYRDERSLNDWGYFGFVWASAKKINNGRKNESLLMTWFVLLKSGYKIKVGLIDKNLVLFVKSKESIFDIPYFKEKNGEKTYIINFENENEKTEGRLFTYEDDYVSADKYFSLRLNEAPILKEDVIEKELVFSFNSREYRIKVSLNKNIIDYYKDYPDTQYGTYFDAAVSNDVQRTLTPILKEYTKNFSQKDAVNFLLRFVQTAFSYKTDDDNFGREKSLFVEETLYYPFSDCEDRAILFSYLVRKVLNLKTVGIDYPGHIATAVLCNDVLTGDKIKYKGKEYLICDPTYINANAGMSMPSHPISSIENIIEIE